MASDHIAAPGAGEAPREPSAEALDDRLEAAWNAVAAATEAGERARELAREAKVAAREAREAAQRARRQARRAARRAREALAVLEGLELGSANPEPRERPPRDGGT
jgi:hypothetical protein